jgi:TetR/AcrR family transcriptional repressor of nem operon
VESQFQKTVGPQPVGGKRLTAAGRRTRERIITEAADLMRRFGVAGTSIPEVQRAAGVSASQIYHYFEDKQGLVEAVIADRSESVLARQRPVLDALDGIEALRGWCEDAADRLDAVDCAGGCEVGSFVAELAETDSTARDLLRSAFREWQDAIGHALARMQERGELPDEVDVDALAVTVLSAIQGGMLLSQLRRSSVPYRQAVHTMIDFVEALTLQQRPARTAHRSAGAKS